MNRRIITEEYIRHSLIIGQRSDELAEICANELRPILRVNKLLYEEGPYMKKIGHVDLAYINRIWEPKQAKRFGFIPYTAKELVGDVKPLKPLKENNHDLEIRIIKPEFKKMLTQIGEELQKQVGERYTVKTSDYVKPER